MKRGGVPPSQTEQDIVPVNLCDEFRFLVAAMNGVGPNLKRVALADGLQKASRFSSAVLGDGVFDRRGKVWGGDFIRAIRWEIGCKCWKVVDRDVKRGR